MEIDFTSTIRKTSFDVMCDIKYGFIDKNGKIIPTTSTDYLDKALELLKSFDNNLIENNIKPFHIDKYMMKNINIITWLIINYGYMVIDNYRAIYCLNQLTDNQCEKISCIIYKDTLIDKNTVKAKRIIKNRAIENYYKNKYNHIILNK